MKNHLLNVLVLTDHKTHSVNNSLYTLVQHMYRSKRCASIEIASRSNPINNPFFYDHQSSELYVTKVDEDFQFERSQSILSNHRLFKKAEINSYNLVFIRLPRPVTDAFLLWLETLFVDTLIVNKPSGIIATSNKKFLLEIAEHCPPMQLVNKIGEIISLAELYPIVLKPLKAYGGAGILKIDGDHLEADNQTYNTYEYLNKIESEIQEEGFLAMKFLKNVSQGDKRIIVVDGTIMACALRLPEPESWLCNVAQGGRSIPSEATEKEKYMIKSIAPIMRKYGVLIYGVDTLVNDEGQRVISEINTLSVGGFRDAQIHTGLPIIQMTIEKLFKLCN